MKRIGIIFMSNLRYAPFVKYYTNILDTLDDVEYEVIYYNRDRSLHEPNNKNYIPVPWVGKGTNAASKLEKAFNFALWKVYTNRLVKRKKYDFVIVIMTTAAVLLEKTLTRQYDGKFIFDVRDYTQEHVKWFFEAEKKLVTHSCLNVISSPGFKKFMPPADYVICHNFAPGSDWSPVKFIKRTTLPIQISYIGSISYEEQCIELMRLVNKDERFSFLFYGNENTSHRVSQEAQKLKNPRIRMMGPFLPNEKREIYKQSALVFNCYGNQGPLVLHAISNKHYDGALYRVPVLNSPGTIMAELAGEYGYILDLGNIENLDGLYQWYVHLNPLSYEKYADHVVETALTENQETKEKVISAIRG